MRPSYRSLGLILITAVFAPSLNGILADEPAKAAIVATTPHFEFHSEFATNLNDALVEAGRARIKKKPEFM